MRADRLLALLMLLQTHGRMSARALAKKLEVSERTIYRDVVALSAAGAPIYGEPGAEGGYALVDGYRTTLTGLSQDETRALFMLNIPGPLADLGLAGDLRQALLKLAAALPAGRGGEQEVIRQRVHIDAGGWRQGGAALPHLQSLYQALWHDRLVRIAYPAAGIGVRIEQTVAPYGLVARAGDWYLVCAVPRRSPPAPGAAAQTGIAAAKLRAQRVAALLEAELLEQTFERPADFDLAAYWAAWCAETERQAVDFSARVRAAPAIAGLLQRNFAGRLLDGAPDPQGWPRLELRFASFEEARQRLLGYGAAVEALEPPALRWSIADYARQTASIYEQQGYNVPA